MPSAPETDLPTVTRWAQARIKDILATPGMWGASQEALELQVLLLLEVQVLDMRPDILERDPRLVLDTYTRKLRERFPKSRNLPLHKIRDVTNLEAFVEHLGVLWEATLQEVLGPSGGI
jgi:hypothetical protein